MSVPLDQQQITDNEKGKECSNPALHPNRMEKKYFVPYKAPPVDTQDKAEFEEWIERLQFIAEDLHWLLQQPHDKFWCQVVFDEKLHALLDSYLRFAPRSYDVIYDLPEAGREKQKEVHRLVFMTSLRMATHKESKDKFITPKVFGEILYENFLFDIPKIFDLCVLYGKGNSQLLSKMVSNIFTQQPKYEEDLRATIPTILHVFDNVVAKCQLETDYSATEPKKLGNVHSSETLLTISTSDFQDVLFYIADIGITLSSFLEIYPKGCQILHEFHFEQRLATFYELVIPELVQTVKLRTFDSISHLHLMKQKLHQGKISLQKIFNNIISHTCIQPILENRSEDEMESCVEDFLHTMSAILGERRFLADYESNYSFQDIMDIFSQSECTVDDEQLQYIRNAVNTAFATYGKRKKPSGATTTGGRTSPDGSPGPPDDQGAVGGACGGGASASWGGAGVGEESETANYTNEAFQVEDYDEQVPGAPNVSPVEFESMISAVKDLLPDLGEGFIELALEELNYSVERVINCILEDKVPPSLQDLDTTLPRQPPPSKPELLVETRRNIYDGDEFDVFRRDDIDMSRIHKGKKEEKVALTDKEFIKEFKATYDAYGSADVENSMYDKILYDDEYDDTYDINNVGADDADSADELTSRRQFTTPCVFRGKDDGNEESESSESDSDSKPSDESEPRKRDQFVADPAKLREAAAQRRAAKLAKRGGGQPQRKYNVEGQAKGQGQSDDVNRNRTYKDKHKSSRANHNRRDMSDRKRKF
ncbi:activating signal cointegrator 1 complex subunit 2 [Patella vulgata]|uniref:activating signal cointegrator 1 complex subunit 2 n=1 Tax=Patella vulgata TaxID=6465 RepID=UPI00217F372F|nr:activating signal cointegrator 1 complex subunit 2 [Patella vulgata]